jgi:hypothetical protein
VTGEEVVGLAPAHAPDGRDLHYALSRRVAAPAGSPGARRRPCSSAAVIHPQALGAGTHARQRWSVLRVAALGTTFPCPERRLNDYRPNTSSIRGTFASHV